MNETTLHESAPDMRDPRENDPDPTLCPKTLDLKPDACNDSPNQSKSLSTNSQPGKTVTRDREKKTRVTYPTNATTELNTKKLTKNTATPSWSQKTCT